MKHMTKTFALSIIAIAMAVTIAMPQQISAASDAKKPSATNVQYVTDDQNNKIGIKSFTINPYIYYNLSQDEVINSQHDRTLKLDDAKLLQIARQQIFPKWSIIAEGIFRDQADQLVTIKGSKMMSLSTAVPESFDRHFCTGKVSNGYTDEDWSVDDLANELCQEKSSLKGKTCWDEVRVTGITQIGSLNGARTLMGQELRNCSDDDDITKDEFLGNNHQKNEDKRRLPDLEDDKSGDGFANIVTCVNRVGATGDYDYVTFGIAVYGFDITPVAAENLKYIEAADETFQDGGATVKGQDILMGLAGDHIEKAGISFHNDEEEGTTSYLRNNTTQEVTQSSGLENSVTEESTLSTDDTFEWGMEQELGLEMNFGGFGAGVRAGADPAPCMFPRATVHISNSWHELWSTTKSQSETKSASKTKTTNTEVSLPGHTIAVVKQNLNNTKTTENYQQPVILSYKVAIFAMSGDYFNGVAGGIESSRYDKQWMSVIFDGSDDYQTSGCKALGSLYNRAIINRDTQGYDGAKGKYKTWCDKAAWVKSNKIDWNDISVVLSLDNRSSHRITLGNGQKATTIRDLATELPLVEKAQMLTSKRESITSSVEEILPLYSLKSVGIKSGAREFDLTPGNTLYLNSIDLEGYDKGNAEFYEFDKDWGEWVLLDEDGNVIEGNQDGSITLVNDTNLDTQKVVVTQQGESVTEDHYLGWKLKDSAVITSNEELNRPNRSMTKEEKENVETPSILVHVKNADNDIENFEIEGTYKGPVGESVNLNHVLTANAVDSTGKIRGVPVFWESRGTTGITVDQSGQATFTKKGTYQVRPYCYSIENNLKIVPRDDNNKPVWMEVVAQDKASINSIVIQKPEFEVADTTLSEGITALGFDLASYTKFYNQYGEKWEGTSEEPLPVIRYGVSGPNGADIDRDSVLTITRPGTYKVTAKAYDQDGNDIGINIAPITIEVQEQEYLASITMDEPAMSRKELTLKDQDCITVGNLKGLLTYLDQNNDEWTGKKPNVTFSIAGDPSDAQIKGGTFYAYAPGTYTIVPSAAGYRINSIEIVIEEDPDLILKTEDPGKQYLYTEDDTVELELERYINATTSYGGRWKGDVPELIFTLENAENATIETRTVYDGDDDYTGTDKHFFKTGTVGEYILHVQPLKASAYTEPLDDMRIRVVKGKKVARIEFKNLETEANVDDFTINTYTGDYPDIDLSKYLKYYDGFGNLIDPVKDHVKIPDCEYKLLDDNEYEADDYELKRELFTPHEPDIYFIEATMNVTNYDPYSSDEEEAKEDTILEAIGSFTVYDIDWLHDFSEWETIKEPTCSEDGIRVRRCTGGEGCIYHEEGAESGNCDAEITDKIPATGHHWSQYYRFDSSNEVLYTWCENCGAINEASKTSCPGNFSSWYGKPSDAPIPDKQAKCTTSGEYVTTTGRRVTVPAVGHSWEYEFYISKEPSCTENGIEGIKLKCTRCGKESIVEGYQRSIPRSKHVPDDTNWHYDVDENGKELKETCVEYGWKVTDCTNGCGIPQYELIMPTGHKWGEPVVVKATPDKDGTITEICDSCGEKRITPIKHPDCSLAKTSYTYNGKVIEPEVRVTANGDVIDPSEYTVAYAKNIKAGKADVEVTFKGSQYEGVKTLAFTIKKAANPLTVKRKTAKVKFSKVKDQKLKVSKVIKVVKKGQGTVTYAKKSGSKKIIIDKKTGKVTVKKGLKKGTYKVKVKVKAKGNANYKSAVRTLTFTVKVI